MTRGRRFADTTAAQVDCAVERQQERQLAEYEAEQDQLQAEQDERPEGGSFGNWQRAA